EGPSRLHPLQAACRKLQEGAETRPVNLHQQREQSCRRGPAGSTHYRLPVENYRRGRRQDQSPHTRRERAEL
ncbi:unnamed protein product, partial [Staurois parvus]